MSEMPAALATNRRPNHAIYTWVLCLLILVVCFFRLPMLYSPPLGADEGMAAEFVFANGLSRIVTQFALIGSSTNTHVFYSVMMRLAVDVLGPIPLAVRLPAFFMGVLCFPALFVLGRRLLGERAALLAALLLVFSHRHWYYSIHGRGYSTVILTTILAFYFFWRGWQHNRRSDWFAFAFATVVGTYTHLTGLFPLGAQGVFAVADAVRTRRWRTFIAFAVSAAASVAILLILYLPMLTTMAGDASGQPYIPPFIQSPGNVLGLLAHIGPSIQQDVVSRILLIFFLSGIVATLWRRPAIAASFLLWMVIPLAIAFTIRVFMFERFLLPLTGAYLLFVACGLLTVGDLLGSAVRRLWLGWPRPAASLLLSAAVVVSLSYDGFMTWITPSGPDWNEVRDFLADHVGEDDVLIAAPSLEGYAFLREGIASGRRIGLGGRVTTDRFCLYYRQPRRTWWILWPSDGEWEEEGYQVYPFRELVIVTREEPIATPEEAVAKTTDLLETLWQQWESINLPKQGRLMQRLFYSLGDLYLGQGDITSATRLLNRAVPEVAGGRREDRASAYLDLGSAYLMQGEMEAAEDAFQQAGELGATEEALAQAQATEPGIIAGLCQGAP